MSDETVKEPETKPCKYDKKFICSEQLETAGCQLCLAIATRELLFANHNLLRRMSTPQPVMIDPKTIRVIK